MISYFKVKVVAQCLISDSLEGFLRDVLCALRAKYKFSLSVFEFLQHYCKFKVIRSSVITRTLKRNKKLLFASLQFVLL